MTNDRIQIPCLDEKVIDRKKLYNYRQWLEGFTQNTKRKGDTDIGPLIKEEAMNGIKWEVEKEKI